MTEPGRWVPLDVYIVRDRNEDARHAFTSRDDADAFADEFQDYHVDPSRVLVKVI